MSNGTNAATFPAAKAVQGFDEAEKPRDGLTPRDFLKAGGAAKGAAALSGTIPALAGSRAAPRIGIIRAGIAGLNAALTLQDKGIASAVFEASDRIGGRMHSLMSGYWANGQTSKWCGELIDSSHKTIMRARAAGEVLSDIRTGAIP